MIAAWPFQDPLMPLRTSTGAPVDNLASFQPDVGPPLSRRRATARVQQWEMQVILDSFDKLAQFESWFEDDLQDGAMPFVWRKPASKEVTKWRISPASYDKRFLGGPVVGLSFTALLLPNKLWFAPYVPENTVRLPAWVADYADGVYGVGDEKGAASTLSSVSGTFLVWERTASGQNKFYQDTFSEDVPQTAPGGVAWLVGFET